MAARAEPTLRRATLEVGLPLVLAAALLVPQAFRNIDDSDPGWHLAQGRTIVTSGKLLTTNLYAWPAVDHDWYPASWLYDVAAWEATSRFGPFGLQALTWFFAVAALVLLAIACRSMDRWGAWLIPAIALLLLPRIAPRPHVAAWVIITAVLALCVAGQSRGWRYRLACLPIITFGFNLHEGALFAAGVCVFFCLEAWWQHRQPRDLLLATGAVAALLLQPGGLHTLVDTTRHLWLGSVIQLAEYEHPTLRRAPTFYLLIPLVLGAALLERKRRPVFLLLTIVFAALGCLALRMVYEFDLVAAPVLAAGVAAAGRRWGSRVGLLSVLLLIVVLAGARASFLRARPEASFNAHILPVKAARFIAQRAIKGRVWNAYNDGGFLEYAVPGLLVFQDGRVHAFPDDFFSEERAADGDPAAFQKYLDDKGVAWVIVSRHAGPLSGAGMMDGPAWALIYWDDASEIYVRRSDPRFGRLLATEYRFFKPGSHLLGTIRQASAGDLGTIRSEIDRFEQGAPPDFSSALARCGVEVRLHLESYEASCLVAEHLAPDPKARSMIALVERIGGR